ncbi:MAG: flagellar motor switch protein FliN [Planctomycetaceae bacterium]|jgi:flagellar motor switch protein FliN/FliY|nr:flagellar motor switch protein FliN [Planctomycetaceae bacterium]
MSDDNAIDQNAIEKLLAVKSGGTQNAPETASAREGQSGTALLGSTIDQSDVEKLMNASKMPNNTSSVGSSSSSVPPQSVKPESSQSGMSAATDDGNKVLGQNDVEKLLQGTIRSAPAKAGAGIGVLQGSLGDDDGQEEGVPQGDIDYLLKRAEEALESIAGNGSLNNGPPEVVEFQFPEFGGSTPNSEHATLDQISEVELDIKIELGRTNMYLEDILKLRKGSVVALDKIAGDAVDIYVNERLIARGEVLVMNDNFCVRVAELLAGAIPIE